MPAVPLHMRELPRDERGYPIPAMVQYDKAGKPLFPVIDMRKWFDLAQGRCCGVCGRPMRAQQGYWFVGGPLCFENHAFTDLPMHRECAVFSLKVCPFLALPRFRYILRDVTLPDGTTVNVNEHVSTKRPERFGLGKAVTYRVQMIVSDTNPGSPLLSVPPFELVEWWCNGERIEGIASNARYDT
jgi:hypothetical protein